MVTLRLMTVCVRMAAHAHYSVCQSVSLDDYYKVYKIKMCYPHQISTRIACWILCQPWADRDLALSLGVGPNLRMTVFRKKFRFVCQKLLFHHPKFLLSTFFSHFLLYLTSNKSSSRNIEGTDAWPVPHFKFLGDRPPAPPKSPPVMSTCALPA